MRKCAAVVLAAGLGTRMKSKKAKVLHEVAGRPMGYFPVKAALASGASRIVVVVGHQGEIVAEKMRGLFPKADLRFATQDKQLGTGHAVLSAKKALAGFDGDVLVLYGDVPLLGAATLRAFRKYHAKEKATASVLSMYFDDPTGYGRVLRNPDGNVERIVEERDTDEDEKMIDEVNSGVGLFDKKVLFSALAKIGTNNDQGEYYLTDVIEILAKRKKKVAGWCHDEPVELMGINDRADLAVVAGVMRHWICLEWMKKGVTLTDPESTFIDEGIRIGNDTEIGPGVCLKGATRIGKGCLIEAGAHLTDAVLADEIHIKPYSVIEDGKIAKGAQIGPFARIRPGTQVGPISKVGNFVELKKVKTGRNTKISHLTYLGDAELGSNVNVGAGTITCNYDGVNKFKTIIKDGAFIGSDSQLVAPVTVGKGAYIGSGSTITKDVPAEALAVTRAPLFQKKGYAKKYRKKK
jgi:bifunctional UDP-N-acetylglucosamine pyrophosphorylase / glucosamine-1-phosphate N-acetyltransferase